MPEPALRRYAATLRVRDFRLLVVSFLIDSVGSWAATIVVSIWLFERTGSLVVLAVLTAAGWLPGLLLGPVAGVIADRFDRRSVMVVCAVLCGVVYSVMTGVIAADGSAILVVALRVVAAVVSTPYRPAAGALTPAVVDEATLPAANGLFATLEELVVIVGPAIGGLMVLLGAAWVGIGVNALSFFAAAALAAALQVRSHGDAESGESVARQFAAGVRELGRTPTAAVLLVFMVLDSAVASAYTVVYIPISRHVGMGAQGYGYLLAGAAVGGVLGAGIAERLSARSRLAPVILGGLLVQALPYAATAAIDAPALAIALQAVSGFGMIVVDVLALTAVQREVASGALSRVLSLLDMGIIAGGLAASFALAGLLAALPYAVVLIVFGVGVAVIAVALSPLLVRADRRTAARAVELAGIVDRLEAVELFAGVPRPGLERLAAAATTVRLAPGDVLIREGEPADAVYALISGTLAVRTAATAARGARLPAVVAPDAVGEIGVLRRIPRTATVTAVSAATLHRVSGDAFLDALTPERAPLAFSGRPATRLARTHPQLVAEAS